MAYFVYALTNEAMPDLVKIGITSDLEKRLNELYKTGVPIPFQCNYAVDTENKDTAFQLEKDMHKLFSENRINPNREFFRVSPERVALALRMTRYPEAFVSLSEAARAEPENITAVDIAAVEKTEKRRERLSLSKLGIPAGSQLIFTRDDNITCITTADDKVIYENETMSLSAAARKVLNEKFNNTNIHVSGSIYWQYGGEILDEIRRDKEEQATE